PHLCHPPRLWHGLPTVPPGPTARSPERRRPSAHPVARSGDRATTRCIRFAPAAKRQRHCVTVWDETHNPFTANALIRPKIRPKRPTPLFSFSVRAVVPNDTVADTATRTLNVN